jgi:hypothetical protein
MKYKLCNNTNHFNDEQACIAYVFSCMEGNVTEYLEPWMADENNPFLTTNEILDYLKAIYVNLNYKINN